VHLDVNSEVNAIAREVAIRKKLGLNNIALCVLLFAGGKERELTPTGWQLRFYLFSN
jgi:hypothetical protein